MGRTALIVVAATALAGVAIAFLLRSGRWKQRRLWPLTIAILAAYALLARRLGWGELAIVAAVVVVPMLFVPRRAP